MYCIIVIIILINIGNITSWYYIKTIQINTNGLQKLYKYNKNVWYKKLTTSLNTYFKNSIVHIINNNICNDEILQAQTNNII